MPRNFTYSALALRVRPSGESNREAWFLTAEEGILRATVFGGPKSKLRAQVSPFNEGRLMLYHDPVKDSRKVSDFDVVSWKPGLRERYERVMAAGAAAETILASHGGGGNWPSALKLAVSVLDALERADAAACSRLAVYFFWHWAEILGVRPNIEACAACACEAKRDEVLWYSVRKEALLCGACAGQPAPESAPGNSGKAAGCIKAGPGARLWLKGIESLPAGALARVSLDAPSLEQARGLSQAVLANALGKRLSTWDEI